MSLTTTLAKAREEFDKKFVIKSNAGTGLLRYTDADLIKSFLESQLRALHAAYQEETVAILAKAREDQSIKK